MHFLQKSTATLANGLVESSSTIRPERERAPNPTEAGESRQVLLEAVWAELHKVVHEERRSAPNRERGTLDVAMYTVLR